MNQSSVNNDLIIQLIILLEGFVTISFEILTIRQLIPVVGNSIIVTSLIIGVFLLFLAYGYRKGGTYVNNFTQTLKINFIITAIGLGIGLSYSFIKGFFLVFLPLLHNSLFITLLLYLLLVTAPLVYLLGQTVPITLNLSKQQKTIGALGGKVLHISTLGSFLGAVLTSLLLMNYLGVAWTVFINYFILVVLVIFLLEWPKDFIQLFVVLLAGVLVYIANVYFENKYFVLTNNYANYEVVNKSTEKNLFINDSASSAVNKQLQGYPYIEYIKDILFDKLKLTDKNILVLGAGGFTLSAEKTLGNHFTYVDIDPKIKTVVQQYFLKTIKGDFIAADARQFLLKKANDYDVIVVDTYSNQTIIPAYLLTAEYFASIYQALKIDGTVIFNVIANPTFKDNYSKRVDNTIRSIFKNCVLTPLPYADHFVNIIYICRKTASENEMIYRDNLNRATIDSFN